MIFFIFLSILSSGFAIYCLCKKIEIDNETREENEIIKKENKQLNIDKSNVLLELNSLQNKKENIQEIINTLQNNAKLTYETQTELSKKAFENYCDSLEKEYEEKEKEFNSLIETLQKSYDNQQDILLEEINSIKADLEKIHNTRVAALAAQKKEEEIKNNLFFYCLQIPEEDKREINIIRDIEYKLKDPRPVRMLIWSNYYLKRANEVAARVLGPNDITGIYKITNQLNDTVYIGQAKNIRLRWHEHLKAGLGIDTPAGNRLYKAMKDDGLENFSFELLEECSNKELNEKEKFYINLYEANVYGYNSNAGIGENKYK